MSSKTEIANLALSHLGISTQITNLDTERSAEANGCNKFFNLAIKSTLSDFAWPFSIKIAPLGLVENFALTQTNKEWGYSYTYPSDCEQFIKIQSGVRNDTRQSRVSYRIVHGGGSTRLIYADQPNAIGEYVMNIDNADDLPTSFVLALSYRLAIYIAPLLTAGDPFKLGERAAQFYNLEISNAQANSANEEQPDIQPDSEFERARNDGWDSSGSNCDRNWRW